MQSAHTIGPEDPRARADLRDHISSGASSSSPQAIIDLLMKKLAETELRNQDLMGVIATLWAPDEAGTCTVRVYVHGRDASFAVTRHDDDTLTALCLG